jgi:hypothetical protein
MHRSALCLRNTYQIILPRPRGSASPKPSCRFQTQSSGEPSSILSSRSPTPRINDTRRHETSVEKYRAMGRRAHAQCPAEPNPSGGPIRPRHPVRPSKIRDAEYIEHRHRNLGPIDPSFLIFIALLALLTGILYLAGSVITRYHIELEVSIGFGVTLLVLACFSFRARCRNRTLYGVVELAFGVGSVVWASRELLYRLLGNGTDDPRLGADYSCHRWPLHNGSRSH